MLKIGLTGNIGSGKSTVATLFMKKGVPVFNSDNVAKNMLFANKDKIRNIFGDSVFNDEDINTKKLASIVFADKTELKKLTDVTFPLVEEELKRFYESFSDQPYCIVENAILFENESENEFDYIITVAVGEETRFKRVMARDNASKEEVQARLNNQLSEAYKMSKSHFVINNNDNADLDKQIEQIEKNILDEKYSYTPRRHTEK
jgi:dephospho-CoA kinase